MPESALGHWLKRSREDRGLSLREVAQRGEVDHAYIYRLETGAKEAPSEDVVARLASALALSARDREVLAFLAAANPNIDPNLLEFVRSDPAVAVDEFHMLATVVNRGARPDYATSLARVRRIMREEEDG